MSSPSKRKPRFSLVFEPETLVRIGRHADRHFKGNKSLVVQIAVDRFLEALEEQDRRDLIARDEKQEAA